MNEKLFTELTSYVALQINSDGILRRIEAMRILSKVKDLKSTKSRNKCFNELIRMGWIGYDAKNKKIYLRNVKKITPNLDYNIVNVVSFSSEHINQVKSFVYSVVLSEKLQQQKSAIFLNSGNNSATKKGRVALQSDYCGVGKYGLASLFQCSTSEAVKIKNRLVKDGFIATKKRYKKIHTLKRSDMNIKHYLNIAFPGKSDKLSFVKNNTGGVDIIQQLHDEIKSKLCLKKRKFMFQGIRKLCVA
jgi:hypothetical protein